MKSFRSSAFIVIVILQMAVLGIMIAKREHLLDTGKKIILKCEPVDPRSFMSGDYVILNYQISLLDQKLFSGSNPDSLSSSKTVYVALEKPVDSRYWNARAFSTDFDTLKKTYPLIIRGIVENIYSGIRVRYGIENYFVPQRQGLQIEQKMADVSAEISVSESGESALCRLFINDREVDFY